MSNSGNLSKRIQALAEKFKLDEHASRLAQALFGNAFPEDVEALEDRDLERLTKDALAFMQVRKPGRASIRIVNLEDASEHLSHISVIELLNDDMPFLMDSVMALLAELGLDITLMVHPVLSCQRAPSGKLISLDSVAEEASRSESFIHIHVSRIRSDDRRKSIEKQIAEVLADVRRSVLDWRAIMSRIKNQLAQFEETPPPVPINDLTESIAFVQWLLDDNFTFLGLREFEFNGAQEGGNLIPDPDSGLGILRNPEMHVLERGKSMVTMTPEVLSFLMQPAPLFVTKSDVVANVHRRVPMDYIGIKKYDRNGNFVGEMRVVGLFTSSAYTMSASQIPLIRNKLTQVMTRSGFDSNSHSGKGLLNVLEQFPRDELFQIDIKTLAEIADGVLRLQERPRPRVFIRRDKFDRSVSAFMFFPRDRFQSDMRRAVGEKLARSFNGEVASFQPYFGEGALIRVHYIIKRLEGPPKETGIEVINAEISKLVRSWQDRLEEALDKQFDAEEAHRLKTAYRDAFSASYMSDFGPTSTIADIREIEALEKDQNVAVVLYHHPRDHASTLRLKLFNYHAAVPLSDLLPVIENMGLKAIDENTYTLTRRSGTSTADIFVHEVMVKTYDDSSLDVDKAGAPLETTFMAVWSGEAENDRFNALTLKLQLYWRDAALIRALSAYLRQAGIPYSLDYIAETLIKHATMTQQMVALFHLRFGLEKANDKSAKQKSARHIEEIEAALNEVPSLAEDTIIRRLLNLIQSISRTNYFQKTDTGDDQPAFAFKINSKNIMHLPEPRPFAEIFVYSPDLEGVHLRAGMIARGGLRWSDRPQDFRTEVLGLLKAQIVKNAVIVPVGAKGGFVPKKLPVNGSREDIFTEGTRAYKLFISSLLQVTDNLAGDEILPPRAVARRDGDDPYLVVAADKGTATFSDTANELAEAHGFWLGDAFASGGSAGYDHKVMGITARGAWEAVKRHFREIDKDIQSEPFSVIGVGDMSGDVFGNGMLLSEQICLQAAFDHRDIFLDPTPDPAAGYAERKRLFETPRTTWQDYDKSLISTGGGVFSRSLKSIDLSPQIKSLTGLDKDTVTPNELLQAILQMPAELLWFGGIGTYVRATAESDLDAGDRANDPIRITAQQLRVKAIGEGANLGLTQLARIEFALNGGRINTDAVDNSAGVNSSDVEVNIKIALSGAEAAGELTRPARNDLLAEMTDEVAGLCLRNNYLQTLSVSMCEMRGVKDMPQYGRLMRGLEHRNLLDRRLEQLPDDLTLAERASADQNLSRPELSVLMAYAKNVLFDELLASDVPDDSYFENLLFLYFPTRLTGAFAAQIAAHKLRREIIATMLANSMINRGGITFISRLQEETGHSVPSIAAAYALARGAFDFADLNNEVDALDNKIAGRAQLMLYLELQQIMRRMTMWFLRNETLSAGLESIAARYRQPIRELGENLETILPDANRDRIDQRAEFYRQDKVPEGLARKLAGLRYLQRAPDIIQVAEQTNCAVDAAAKPYFAAGGAFRIDKLVATSVHIQTSGHYERLAINRTIDSLLNTHRGLIAQMLANNDAGDAPWARWQAAHQTPITRLQHSMDDLLAERSFGLAQLAVANSLLGDLAVDVAR